MRNDLLHYVRTKIQYWLLLLPNLLDNIVPLEETSVVVDYNAGLVETFEWIGQFLDHFPIFYKTHPWHNKGGLHLRG